MSAPLKVLIGCATSCVALGHNNEISLQSRTYGVEYDGPAGVCTATSGPNRNGSCEDHVMADEALAPYGDQSQFRPIPGFPRYLVSRDGHIFSARLFRGKIARYHRLALSRCKKGYNRVVLCNEFGHSSRTVHRIVAMAFVENPDGMPCVRHVDGNPHNNSAENLAWGTYAQNEEDKRDHGTWDLRRTGKLTAQDRAKIRRLHSAGWTQKDLASQFSVSRPTITRLVNGTIWGNDHAA